MHKTCFFLVYFNLKFIMGVVQLIKTKFSAHSLKIHCVGLFGPKSFYFLGLRTKMLPLQELLKFNTKKKKNLRNLREQMEWSGQW